MATASQKTSDEPPPGRWSNFLSVVALFLWLGGIHMNVFVCLSCLLLLIPKWALTALGIWLTSLIIPTFGDSGFAKAVSSFIAKRAPQHFPMEIHVEDIDAFDPHRSYVFATEPHSVLPISMILLTPQHGFLPIPRVKALATSIIFWTPVLRHVWSWLGLVPASRAVFTRLLEDGYSVVLVPGGVQECLYLKYGHETIFLKRRFGFLRCAMEAGSSLVPSFCFGQSEAYHYWKPSGGWYSQISRAIGFTPLVFWGMYGSPIPYPNPMYLVVGKPIPVDRVHDPSTDQITAVQEKFITAMKELFERHKVAAGFADCTLTVN